LVLQLIEAGQAPRGLGISEPVEALQEISRDPDRQWMVRLESGQSMSAIDIQEQFLAAAQRHCKGQDEETDWVLEQWESVLTDLRSGYEKLVGRIDWASKLWLLETYREAEQLTWDDPMLKSLDLEYHNLHPERGLCYGLEEEGRGPRLTTDKGVQLAEEHPPRNTRAFGRGELVRHLLACGAAGADADAAQSYGDNASCEYIINWSNFKLRDAAPFFMADPFKTYVQDVRSHLSGR